MSEPTEEEIVQQVYNLAINLHVEQGMSKEASIQKLQESGLNRETACLVINDVRDACRKQYGKQLFFGLLWLIGGIVVTIGTYEMAKGGGTYVVAWGAILYGLIASVANLFRLLRYQDL